ncbi:hypothetical protein SSYRP_v1c00790 [Spiroplasma syrphidicola EA-1]|uniref:Uncharacterized protein n=1 Tax=Spiroplasma syrphidicola EA-1 TaxID=1276229 RepID=R4UHS7_9MOLU|nr:hypothetical protein [Spiroplasma syrphidicola]AGM25675.1 hypothetical protein SSYRP_v1c00790 [Spiroplasma syrphidicola EA-1]
MKHLISLLGIVGLTTTVVTPVVSVNQENNLTANINDENYINYDKKQAMDFTDYAIFQLGSSVEQTDVTTKLNLIRLAYPSVSQAYEFLNDVEHTSDIVQAKKLLLEGADYIDQAARQGNNDAMNNYSGKAIKVLSTALKYISYNINDIRHQAMDFTDYAIFQLGSSVEQTDVTTKLNLIRLAYPSVSQAYEFLNDVEHTSDIVQAKKLLLEGADYIDQAARQGNNDAMNNYSGKAIKVLSTALKYIGFSLL